MRIWLVGCTKNATFPSAEISLKVSIIVSYLHFRLLSLKMMMILQWKLKFFLLLLGCDSNQCSLEFEILNDNDSWDTHYNWADERVRELKGTHKVLVIIFKNRLIEWRTTNSSRCSFTLFSNYMNYTPLIFHNFSRAKRKIF